MPIPLADIRCPFCGAVETLEMPNDACVYFHECGTCRVVMRPKQGECCVICSYGSVQCPPRRGRDGGTYDRGTGAAG